MHLETLLTTHLKVEEKSSS